MRGASEWRQTAWRTLSSRAKSLHPPHVIAAIALLLIIVDTLIKPISAVALGLAVLMVSPWIVSFLKSVELPGGVKFEFREELKVAEQKAQQAGLLAVEDPVPHQQPIFKRVYREDPRLGLAGLRIALEEKLIGIAETAGLRPGRGLGRVLLQLERGEVLPPQEIDALRELVPLLNQAVHSDDFAREAGDWAMDLGPKMLSALSQRAIEIRERAM